MGLQPAGGKSTGLAFSLRPVLEAGQGLIPSVPMSVHLPLASIVLYSSIIFDHLSTAHRYSYTSIHTHPSIHLILTICPHIYPPILLSLHLALPFHGTSRSPVGLPHLPPGTGWHLHPCLFQDSSSKTGQTWPSLCSHIFLGTEASGSLSASK